MNKDEKPANSSFDEWISGASIYIGRARYGQLGGYGFVVASKYEESEELRNAVEDLDGGDFEALEAEKRIEKMDCWYANHPDPAVAMQLLMGKMREFQRFIDGERSRELLLKG